MKRPEQQLQIAVAQYLGVALRAPTIWTAFPAGGGGRTRGAFLKTMGLQAGWPDILVMHQYDNLPDSFHGWTCVAGIELKAAKGDQSPAQKKIALKFAKVGAFYHVCRSLHDVEFFLRRAGVPLHATASATPQERDAA